MNDTEEAVRVTSPTPNLPLLRKILSYIDAHPERWDQEDYVTQTECGTAYCVAGHAVAMTIGVRYTAGRLEPATDAYRHGDIGWGELAARELGLTDEEADKLFAEYNDRDDLQRLADEIADRAGEVL